MSDFPVKWKDSSVTTVWLSKGDSKTSAPGAIDTVVPCVGGTVTVVPGTVPVVPFVGSVGFAGLSEAAMAIQITVIKIITKTAMSPRRISRVSVFFLEGRLRLCSIAMHQSFCKLRINIS